MLLLKHARCDMNILDEEVFTFHYASIKTKMQGDDFKDVNMYLHFIMLLLKPVLLYRCYINILG